MSASTKLIKSLAPRILFEDQNILVLSKPAGLLSQGEKTGEINLVDWLRQHFGRNYVGLIHRLDRNTSGLMVIGKRSKAAKRLTEALQEGKLERRYTAILIGSLRKEAVWSHYLIKDNDKNIVKASKTFVKNAKQASLTVKPIKIISISGAVLTVAEFLLETGRSHQIRVQAAAEGFPLLGDTKYTKEKSEIINKLFQNINRPALHSSYLSFPHPICKETMQFSDKLPEDMERIISELKSPKNKTF
ncbi:MAG: hypothetical protein A3K03_02230 [Bdellovibrionales bacterium RIFOXYD1_FULL_44_7]|nr:MAG: hypothetical protein A3K03_02230 [Bdellovibrionales bacterium RIFOXYD1_FULL_44_7]